MINIPPSALEAFIFANTPSYLYKHLSNDELLSQLKNRSETELHNYISNIEPNYESIITAYASMIALLQQGEKAENILKSVQDPNTLNWAEPIINLYIQQVIPTNRASIRIPMFRTTAPTTHDAAASRQIIKLS